MLLSDTRQQMANAQAEIMRPFPQEEELKAKEQRLVELNTLLNLDEKETVLMEDTEPEESKDRELCAAER